MTKQQRRICDAALEVSARNRRVEDLTLAARRPGAPPEVFLEIWDECLRYEKCLRNLRSLVADYVPSAGPERPTVRMRPLPPAGDPLYDLGTAAREVVDYVDRDEVELHAVER